MDLMDHKYKACRQFPIIDIQVLAALEHNASDDADAQRNFELNRYNKSYKEEFFSIHKLISQQLANYTLSAKFCEQYCDKLV